MLLTARQLSKTFGDVAAVSSVDLDLSSGETLALIGPSGCGKTTLLKLLNRLIEPDTGELELGGEQASAVRAHMWRRQIGYVVQSAGLFPHMSVADNVAITPKLMGWSKADIDAKVTTLLKMTGLPIERFGARRPSELSGGQRQRVGLARALAGTPQLVLMDEPFSALDPATKDQLIDDVTELREELGFSAIIVTHDFSEALRFADQIAVMDHGRIVQTGTAAELMTFPAHQTVERLLAAPKRTATLVSKAFGEMHVR